MTRLLLVEDDAANRLALEAILADEGYQVDTAASFAEARALLAAGAPYDVALLDVHLGDGAGTALLPHLRERHPAARVVFMSGSSAEIDATLRADARFEKGDDPERLLSALAGLAGRASC